MGKSTPIYSDSQRMMTLCAISYADEGEHISVIKEKFQAELSKEHYATEGKWEIVWGPARTGEGTGDNLIYIAKSTEAAEFAVVLRGTVWNSLKSWIEDIPTALVDYTWAGDTSAVKVASEFLGTIKELITLTGPDSGTSFSEFVTQNSAARWLVAGHSQGGGLAPMMHGYVRHLLDHSNCASYSFAAPTSGNPAFADFVDKTLDATRTINPLDIVPFGYAGLPQIWEKHIPVKSTISDETLKLAVELWEYETGLKPEDFGQPQKAVVTLAAHPDPDPSKWYEKQVEAQHNYNSYLWLMGAPQTDVGTPSPLDPDQETQS